MIKTELNKLPFERIKDLYREHLIGLGMGESTIKTTLSDTFYLWKNANKEVFWQTVISNDFEEQAKNELYKTLTIHSSGKIETLVVDYLNILKKFKTFVVDFKGEVDFISDEDALKNFLLDIDCLDQLDEWTGKFNMFDILKITRAEIRHSNLLAWLLTPNENHGLNDNIIKGFIQFAVTSFSNNNDIFDTLLMDFRSFDILREWHHIDVLAISDKEKYILCIENKIDTGEHDNQLARYQKTLEDAFPEYTRAYIYLSPSGVDSSLTDTWLSMSYSDVINIIENACKKTKLLPEAELLINNYIETIRRDIVGDERLAKICAEIYSKHKRALDLIFDNKPDRASDVAEYFRNWGVQKTKEGDIELVLDKCNKTYTRFKTPTMSEILPDADEALSGWNTKNHYFYELINNGGTEFYIQISFSSRNIPDDLREICDEINVHYPSRQQKENWQWRLPFRTKTSKIDLDTSEEKIHELLNKKLEEVKIFEKALKEKMNKN